MPTYIIENNCAKIPLRNRKGEIKYAIVDIEDAEAISQYLWHCRKDLNTTYAVRDINKKQYMMHRILVSAPDNYDVDHIDGNGLNNQKNNLRICEHSDNSKNRKALNKNNSSGYRGVSFIKRVNKYCAQVSINKKSVFLGYFGSAKEASQVFIEAAKKHYGEFFKEEDAINKRRE